MLELMYVEYRDRPDEKSSGGYYAAGRFLYIFQLYFIYENAAKPEVDEEVTAMRIVEISADAEKRYIARCVLEALPEWFGIPEAREEYIRESADKPFFSAYNDDKPIGFLYLKQTGRDTVELAVMGVLKEFHRNGVGKALFECAKKACVEKGFSFIQVKTVQMGKYDEYDITNRFYLSLGFKELEVFPTLWDKWNPCQIYVMAI